MLMSHCSCVLYIMLGYQMHLAGIGLPCLFVFGIVMGNLGTACSTSGWPCGYADESTGEHARHLKSS